MKVYILYQFYLPFVLPRADDWNKKGIILVLDGLQARIRPRALDEPLFLNDVDKSLSTMTFSLARLSPPYGSIQGIVSDHCLDRLEILLETELPSLEHARQMDVQEEMELKAAKSANIFLDHCKAVSASPYPLAVQMNFRPNNQKLFVSNPRTITWFGSADGKEYLGVYEGGLNSVAISGSILSPERGEANMGMIIQNMKNGPYPDLTRSLLLDAEAALISLRLRESVLTIGTALEVASDHHISRKNGSDKKEVIEILKDRNLSFAEKRYVQIPTVLDSCSFAQVDPKALSDIEKVYRVRNIVAHTGQICYIEGGAEIKVEPQEILRFIRSAQMGIEWLSIL